MAAIQSLIAGVRNLCSLTRLARPFILCLLMVFFTPALHLCLRLAAAVLDYSEIHPYISLAALISCEILVHTYGRGISFSAIRAQGLALAKMIVIKLASQLAHGISNIRNLTAAERWVIGAVKAALRSIYRAFSFRLRRERSARINTEKASKDTRTPKLERAAAPAQQKREPPADTVNTAQNANETLEKDAGRIYVDLQDWMSTRRERDALKKDLRSREQQTDQLSSQLGETKRLVSSLEMTIASQHGSLQAIRNTTSSILETRKTSKAALERMSRTCQQTFGDARQTEQRAAKEKAVLVAGKETLERAMEGQGEKNRQLVDNLRREHSEGLEALKQECQQLIASLMQEHQVRLSLQEETFCKYLTQQEQKSAAVERELASTRAAFENALFCSGTNVYEPMEDVEAVGLNMNAPVSPDVVMADAQPQIVVPVVPRSDGRRVRAFPQRN